MQLAVLINFIFIFIAIVFAVCATPVYILVNVGSDQCYSWWGMWGRCGQFSTFEYVMYGVPNACNILANRFYVGQALSLTTIGVLVAAFVLQVLNLSKRLWYFKWIIVGLEYFASATATVVYAVNLDALQGYHCGLRLNDHGWGKGPAFALFVCTFVMSFLGASVFTLMENPYPDEDVVDVEAK